jgi:hypothetical protein
VLLTDKSLFAGKSEIMEAFGLSVSSCGTGINHVHMDGKDGLLILPIFLPLALPAFSFWL